MQMKKKFVTPRVVQEVQIHLEKDLLARSADDTTVETESYFEDHTYAPEDQDWGAE